jgi:hypothetical protein
VSRIEVAGGLSRKPVAMPNQPHDLFLPQPTPEGIEKFKALYTERFGKDLSSQEALELAIRALHFVHLCLNPPPRPVVETIRTSKAERRSKRR